MALPDLTYIAAPMIKQSDAPFRLLTQRHGATLAYTQMLDPHKLLEDRDYLEFHQRDLTFGRDAGNETDGPVVVQLCGNDPEIIVQAGKKIQGLCSGIVTESTAKFLDLNLGCPQEHAREGHYGGYLLAKKDWPLVQTIGKQHVILVSAMSHLLQPPTSVKLRLCPSSSPPSSTVEFAAILEHAGASWVTLHARHVSARRRRQGAADLDVVRTLKTALRVPVVSNGNVRTWEDVQRNKEETRADGIMVGETLLGNPCIFANVIPDPVQVSLEYLEICKELPDIATHKTIETHVRHFIEFQCSRRPWYNKFRTALPACEGIHDIEHLLRTKVTRWRGKAAFKNHDACTDDLEYTTD
ncbi:FMN-linked oxidoreductase [Suillus discolor]|uniref:tRNA-dihydrouridine synthase n=1 Tax=Suillus discolor TaxID=1912936 RepID=A0A9P7JVB7_9AGAM|nr:FMN-linked oxidoreductase [Suillus discolor]KAG2109920.1 FMN-linked oxidoreductase [Suillus discolor]